MKKAFLRYRNQFISSLIIIIAIFLIIGYLWQLKNMELNVPLSYYGLDDYFSLNTAKTIQDSGWVFENNNLGAPFGTQNFDFPALIIVNFDNVFAKLLVVITGNYVVASNLQFLLILPMIALISYFVMTSLKVNNLVAILGSLVFTFSPYMFWRNIGHMVLTQYQFVPLSVLLCVWIYQDDRLFSPEKDFFKYKRNYIALLFCLLIASNGIAYYPFFTCFFLCVVGFAKALNTRKIKDLFGSFVSVLIIAGMLIINLLPVIIYKINEGANPEAAARNWSEAESYALKIIQLFIPTNAHGIGFLEKIISRYNSSSLLVNENVSSYLGIIGGSGFLILLIIFFIRNMEGELGENLKLLSEINIAAILLGTLGGFGSVFSFAISSMIRGYNRISIFILFISILGLCLIMTYVYENISYKKVLLAIMTVICMIGIKEQFFGNTPEYTYIKDTFKSDKEFVNVIEDNVSDGAMIFQLPYHKYPEAGPVNGMNDYHLLSGYLHSKDLKWSYGGMTGRKSDLWNRKIAAFDTEFMIKAISVAGFEGIYIDKRAYSVEEYNNLEQKIKDVLDTTPLYSKNNNLSFFNMSQFNKDYKKLYSKEEYARRRNDILNINKVILGQGFYQIEGEKPDQLIWMMNKAEMIINNENKSEREYPLKFHIESVTEGKANLNISVNGKNISYEIDARGIEVEINLKLKPGKNIIKFTTDATRLNAPTDIREIYLKMRSFNFDSEIVLK